MKGRIFGVMAAATLGLTSLASADRIDLTNVSPPGAGNPGANVVLNDADISVFGGTPATGGSAENMSAADLSALVAAVSPVLGQVYVFAINEGPMAGDGASLVILAGGSFNTSLLNAGQAAGVFQTGGVNVQQVVGGGFTASGALGMSTQTGLESWSAFAYTGMDLWTSGTMTVFGGGSGTIPNNATVNFLTWNDDTAAFDVAATTAMDGSMSFTFQVVPVPAPALLAGVGLLGAGIVRRRMARN